MLRLKPNLWFVERHFLTFLSLALGRCTARILTRHFLCISTSRASSARPEAIFFNVCRWLMKFASKHLRSVLFTSYNTRPTTLFIHSRLVRIYFSSLWYAFLCRDSHVKTSSASLYRQSMTRHASAFGWTSSTECRSVLPVVQRCLGATDPWSCLIGAAPICA